MEEEDVADVINFVGDRRLVEAVVRVIVELEPGAAGGGSMATLLLLLPPTPPPSPLIRRSVSAMRALKSADMGRNESGEG